MSEDVTMSARAQELVGLYRSLSRDLDLEDAARASTVLGQMLVEIERARRVQSDATARLAEEALSTAARLLQDLDPAH